MPNIDKIKLYNFKAFYGEETIEIGGKHLLLYGENGSGKSSIYWALYTLFQSSTKDIADVQKYFNPRDEQNLINYHLVESLCTINPVSAEKELPVSISLNANVEIVMEDGKSFTIDSRGVTAKDVTGAPTVDIDFLKNNNRFSDFISHRLLINFYNFRNSKNINIWEVFVRDVFPFIKTDENRGDNSLSEELKIIEKTLPFSFKTTSTGRKQFSVLKKSENKKAAFALRIANFNNDMNYWIGEINTYVNDFYENNFKNIGDKDIQISLKLEDELEYIDHYDQKYKHNDEFYFRDCNFVGLSNPTISLNIKIKNEDGTFTPIPKPQSYFNEAKLTSIGLAVRFTLLLDFIRPDFEGKFLALDDLLVSLDMSNRDKVLDIILNVFAPKYKIYLFTHERSFFNMVKRRLANRNLLEEWKIKEVFMNDFIDPPKPKIVNTEDYLSIALKHLKNFDLPASANYLRKECELRLKYLLPENLSKKETEDETKFIQLENLITSFIKYFSETLHQDVSKLLILKEKKDLILNPLSHDNLDSEIYKDELLTFHNLLMEMREIKKITLLNCDEDFYFNQLDADGDSRKYKVIAKENLLYYKLLDGSIIHKNISCDFAHYLKNGVEIPLSNETRYNDLQKVAYKHAMNGMTLANYPDHLQEFTNKEVKIFQDVLTELNT